MYDDYMNTEETAKFLGVRRHTVEKWRKKGVLMPDVIGHGKNGRSGVYYYSKEKILQLAAVYCNRTATELQLHIEKKNHIAETTNFFNLLYGKILEPHFAYLFTKHGIFSFSITDESQREDMARKAIELSECGIDVWHSVNPVCVEPTNAKRGDETVVSYQIACVVDIDICSVAHKVDPEKLRNPSSHSRLA